MHGFAGRVAAKVLVVLVGLCGLSGVAGAQVVVSQVYGGGGNSGATLRSDFIELRNNGAAAVSLDGWSVQYASSSGTSWQRTELAGSIAPGGYYLIKQADGSGGSVDLPPPDAVGGISMSSSNGKVALVQSTAALSGSCPLGGAVVDFVGYGSANCFEGSAAAPGLGNTSAAFRDGDGSADTNDNAADFSRDARDPRNSGSEPPEPPPPPTALTIAEIQGAALMSAHVDERVVTDGIVTARRFNNGFFLQAANDDGDAATSEAIFVFTGDAPPAEAAVGNRVRVTGVVEEYTPGFAPNQLSVTEIIDPGIELLAANQPLPAAIELTSAQLGPDALPGTLENLEAMRVSVAEAVVVAPSDGRIDENDALSFTDGVFHVTLPDVPVPFREPGIGVLDVVTIPPGKDPPRFDTNPERLMVRSWGQIGSSPIAVDVGAQVGGLVGVLDYHSATWALLPDADNPPAVSGGVLPSAVDDAAFDEVTIASFNLLRFFDEVDDDNGAVELTPEALDKRLGKTAAAICNYLKAPDILGVVEVENRRVLELLSDRIDATCASAPQYAAYLQPGNDVGGINVGFLVSTRAVAGGLPRVEVLDVTQFGKDATLTNPDGSTDLLNDRPPLRLRARVHHGNGAAYPVTVVVNHLRSLNDVDSVDPGPDGWPTDGHRVRAKRGAQAAYLTGLVESWQQADPDENIVLVGDFNAFEFNDGYVDVLGVLRGDEAPFERVLHHVDSPLTSPLIDGSALIDDPAQEYSYRFAGNAQTLDHVLVNAALVASAAGLDVDHARINADFGVHHFGDAGLPLRVSDHDPVRLSIAVPAFRTADLGVSATAEPAAVRVGETVTFTAQLDNAGPAAAEAVGVAFVFDAALTPAITAPAGWDCAAPAQDAARTTVSCSAAQLAGGASAEFVLQAAAPQSIAGRLRMDVAVQSLTADPANGNNQAAAEVQVIAAADLSLRIFGQAHGVRRGAIATFLVPLTNAGPDAALQPQLVLEGNVPAELAAVAAPGGWECERPAATEAGFRAICRADVLATGTDWLAFAVVLDRRPPGNRLEFAAEVQAGTPDPDTANNRDTLSTRVRGRGR